MRALVIDDARTMRMILRQILQKLGFEVTEAGNGVEGLEQLRKLGRPDVTLVDSRMPEMDGFAFIRAAVADPAMRGMRLVMVTAEEEKSQVARALECGADDYIVKPFTKDTIREKLDRLGLTVNPL